MGDSNDDYVPVTLERCQHIAGPFFHGTKVALEVGDELVPGYGSNFHQGRVSNNIYFTALMDTAVWGAELATRWPGARSADASTWWSPRVRSRTTRM